MRRLAWFTVVSVSAAAPVFAQTEGCAQLERKDLSDCLPSNRYQGNLGICFGYPVSDAIACARKRAGQPLESLSAAGVVISALNAEGLKARRLRQTQYSAGTPTDEALASIMKQGFALKTAPQETGVVKWLDDSVRYRALHSRRVTKTDVRDLYLKAHTRLKQAGAVPLTGFNGYSFAPHLKHKQSRVDSDMIRRLETIDRLTPFVSRFWADYNAAAPALGAPRFSYEMGESPKDRLFGNKKFQDFLRNYAPRYPGYTPAIIAAYLTEDWAHRSAVGGWLGPKPGATVPNFGFDPHEIRAKIDRRCDEESKDLQRYVMDSLCQGVPLITEIDPNGLETLDVTPPQPIFMPGEYSRHAMLIKGFETVNGKTYLTFRNSWPGYSEVRMPLAQSCRLARLSVAMAPGERPVPAPGTHARAIPAAAAESPAAEH